MPHGLKKEIRIGFLLPHSSQWMGGVNYYRNLFYAMSKVENPKLIPYSFLPRDEASKCILEYAEVIDRASDEADFFEKLSTLDITSHSRKIEGLPSIVWIPDFQHIKLPTMFSKEEIEERNKYYLEKVSSEDCVIVSSYDALKDFEDFAPEHKHKGRVLHFVAMLHEKIYEETDRLKEEVISKYTLPQKYFYVPNQFWKHKNHKIIFEALALLKQEGIEINLVCTGRSNDHRHPNYMEELYDFIKKNDLEENIKILGLVENIEVYYLMRNCISLINPSLFEGWASSVEEAKSIGKNIILSDIAVHREQDPPQGIYFDPYDACKLAQILKKKWIEGKSEPDYELEEMAKTNIEKRIKAFGEEYQKIVVSILDDNAY